MKSLILNFCLVIIFVIANSSAIASAPGKTLRKNHNAKEDTSSPLKKTQDGASSDTRTDHKEPKVEESEVEESKGEEPKVEESPLEDEISEILDRIRNQSYEELLNRTQTELDLRQQKVSDRLFTFSAYVDNFFAEPEFERDYKDSRMRFSIANRIQKNESPSYKPQLKLSLALPNTQDRIKLVLSSTEDEDAEGDFDENLIDSTANTTFSSALGLVLLANQLVDIRADFGVRFNTPIDPFTRLRFRKSFHYFDKFEIRLTETLSWRKSRGNSAETKMDLEYPLSDKYFFRSTSVLTYWDVDSFWVASQSLNLFDKLDNKTVMVYVLGTEGQNEPPDHTRKKDQINAYWVDVGYRKNFYKDWLYYEVSPGLLFPRISDEEPLEEDFKPTPRITLKLEAIFGNI